MQVLSSTLLVVAMLGSTAAAGAVTLADAPRSDGHTTPLAVYDPFVPGAGCPPLALVSHGAGGTLQGYRYLADIMVELGYRVIVMGHLESGPNILRSDVRADGLRPGLAALVGDPAAESARLLDVDAALKWADAKCHADFRVLLGHSMGAETVMLEAGARNMIGIPAPPAAQDRFDAYVALSPEGPGLVFPQNAWDNIKKPMLLLTGTRDQSLTGPPQTRQTPWLGLPGNAAHCQILGVYAGASHMNFAGAGLGSERTATAVRSAIGAFLAGIHSGACTSPPSDREASYSAK